MRVSANKFDKGFKDWCNGISEGYVFRVTLNGKDIQQVVTADTTVGYIHKASEPLKVENNEVVMEVLWGKVKIYKEKGVK